MAAQTPIRTTVSDLATFIQSNLPEIITLQALVNMLASYAALYPNKVMPLSAIQPDFEANKAELQALLQQTNAWNDLSVAGVGEALLEMIGTGQTYNQFGIEQALFEGFITTAAAPSSIYTATKMLGNRLNRRVPAVCLVTLTYSGDLSSGSVTLPPYMAFTIGGIPYFSRGYSGDNSDIITFTANQPTINANLYEGTVAANSYISNGTAYQVLTFGNSDFTISDKDILVFVNGIQWNNTNTNSSATPPGITPPDNFSVGLWEFGNDASPGSNDLTFYETTTADGNCQITFGNNINGIIPPLNNQIYVLYATTNGEDGNAILTNSTVACTDSNLNAQGIAYSNLIAGAALGSSAGGSNERSAQDYVTLGPGTFVAKNRPVSRIGYSAFAAQYPGVIDAIIYGQQDIAPQDLKFMMMFEAVLLTDPTQPPWDDNIWAGFITYMEENGIANGRILRKTATPITPAPIIQANVFCFDNIPFGAVKSLALANVSTLFTPRLGYIGYAITESDIGEAIKKAANTVDYYELISPTFDLVPSSSQFIQPSDIILNIYPTDR